VCLDEPVFGVQIPKAIEGVASDVLNPELGWEDKEAYKATVAKLAGMFVKNYDKYKEDEMDFSSAGPRA